MAATLTPNIGLKKPDRADYVSVVNDINDNMDTLDGKIGAVPSGKTVQGQIDTKAEKVSSATSGDFAALDSNGNLTDSGKKTSDFVLASNIATTTETQAIINEYT